MRILIIILLLFQFSCSYNYLTISKLGQVEIGDPYSKYEKEYGVFQVDEIGNYTFNDLAIEGEYRILLYKHIIYDSDNVAFIFPLFSHLTDYSIAALTYKNDKLIFVGFPDEYLRHSDEEINLIGEKISELISNDL